MTKSQSRKVSKSQRWWQRRSLRLCDFETLRLLLLAMLLASCATKPMTNTLDLKITNGLIVDGTGSPWFRGDVGIRGDRIAAVGLLNGARARDTINASDLVISPGRIDMLGHSEYPLLTDGRALSKITQGITSEITGE